MISKRAICATLAAVLVAGGAFAAELESESQKLGYMFGLDIGNSLRQQGVDVDLEAFFDAVRTAYEGGEPAMTAEEAQAIRERYIAERQANLAQEQEAQAAANLAEGQAFLAGNADAEGVTVTESGLQYQVLEEGDGASPAATDQVTVHYRGTLLDGSEFDSSYSRDEPATFALDQVIPGWTEGVQLMSVGSKYRFWIPADLAYGEGGAGPIPPNATLIFDVELLDVQ